MKSKIIVVFISLVLSAKIANAHVNSYNMSNLGTYHVKKLIPECENNYKEDFPKDPLPEAYYKLSDNKKLYYCMRKIMATGNYEKASWFDDTPTSREREYETYVDILPDEYFLINSKEDRDKFIEDGLANYNNKEWNRKRQEVKKVFNNVGNAASIVSPPIGIAIHGIGAAQ